MKTLLTLLALVSLALPAWAQRVTDLPPGNAIGDTDLFLDVQGYTGSGTGTTTKVSGAQLETFALTFAQPLNPNLTAFAAGNPFTSGANISMTGTYPALTFAVSGLATVANSGSYTDLSNKPTLGTLAALNSINNSNWSGTALSVANGGTGTATPSLIGGTNVTVTGTWPNQTISASGGTTLTLTTTGTSGAATLTTGTLNIPQYQGGVTSFNTRTGSITLTSADVNAVGALSNNTTGTATYATTAGSTGTYTGATLGIFGAGTTTIQVVPPGSIYAAVGDSITMGTPYVLATGSVQTSITGTDTLGNTGYSYVQYLSGLPRWHNILCYDFGVSGTRSSAGVAVVTASSQPGGTLYENGAVIGTVGGATMSLATLYSNLSGQGKLIVGTMYGTNDQAGGIPAATTLTNLEATYAAIHALGTNAVSVAVTVPQAGSGSISASSEIQDIDTQLYTAMHTLTPNSSLPDTLADLGGLLSQFPVELVAAGYQNGDYLHLQNKGYQLFAQEVDRACFFGFVRQASIVYPRYTPTIDSTYAGGTSWPCFDLNTGDILSGANGLNTTEFDAVNQEIDRITEGTVINFNSKLLVSSGVNRLNWANQTLIDGGAVEASWATAGQFQIAGMLCGLPNTGTNNTAGDQVVLSNGVGIGTGTLPLLIEVPTGTTSGVVQTRQVAESVWSNGGVYIGTGTATVPPANGLQITGPFASVATSASASFSLIQGINFFTGSTASQTGTLPAPTVAGEEVFIKNQSSVALAVASNSGTQIIAAGATTASASVTLVSGADMKFYSDGTYWNQQ